MSRTTSAERARQAQNDGLSHLTRTNQTNPAAARASLRSGEAIATTTSHAVRAGVAVGTTVTTGSASCVPSCTSHCWNHCTSWCSPCSWWWWGWSAFWWPWWGPSWGFGYWYGNYGYWWPGSPYYYAPDASYLYSPPPVYYSTVINEATAPPADAAAPQDKAAPAASEQHAAKPAEPRPSAAAHSVNEQLALGDQAFRAARYNEAVLAYAKAVEAAPNDGVLHLVFADALFAAGEYHFAAYAIRRALELDPKLLASVVDKHSFYGDPTELDRHLATLERFVEGHYLDDDARLVLAANYLFAARPNQAVELLGAPSSASVRDSSAGQAILARARELATAPPPEKK